MAMCITLLRVVRISKILPLLVDPLGRRVLQVQHTALRIVHEAVAKYQTRHTW